MVNDILRHPKIEVGEFELQEDEIDIGDIIGVDRAGRARARPRAGLSLTSDVAPALPQLRGDAHRVRQILLNLLSTPVKFTSSGGAVSGAGRAQRRRRPHGLRAPTPASASRPKTWTRR